MSGPKHTPTTLRPPPHSAPSGMIIAANFTVTGFGRRWSHCHQLANYFARYASANEGDSERHSTLLSTFFNELFEAVYRNHAPRGQIKIEFKRDNNRVSVRAEVPTNAQCEQFYRHTVELVNQPDPMSWYRERLEHDAPEEEVTSLGLLELAVVYGSKLSIAEPVIGNSLALTIEFPFNEAEEV